MNEQTDSNEDNQVDLNDPGKIAYWCEELSLTTRELLEIVKNVGPSLYEVRKYLAQRMLRTFGLTY